MDTITHSAIGMCLGELIAGKQLGKKAMLYGIIASNIPDADVTTSLWMNHADALLAHRGFTHSILFAALCAPLLALAAVKWSKKKTLSFNQWMLLFGSGLFVHIFLDAFTAYGTGWFEPFSHKRISFNTLFIIDPLFSLPLLIAAILLLLTKKNFPRRVTMAKTGIWIVTIYLIISISVKFYVNTQVKNSFAARGISYNNFMTTPAPLSILLWYIIGKTNSDYYVGYYSIFDKKFPTVFNHVHNSDSLIAKVEDREELDKLIRFSDGYYVYTNKGDTVYINDMRFGQIGGWFQKDAPYVFSYSLQKTVSNVVVLQRGRMEGNSKEALSKLIDRIKGIE